jgi:uncharacterized membrane protein (Fun14 family)
MDNDPNHSPGKAEQHMRSFFSHLLKMPAWHKTVMTLAVFLASAGVVGQVAGYLDRTNSSATTQGATLARSDNDVKEPPFWQRVSPGATKAGLGCIAGFVVGWLARVFFKTIALVTTLGLSLIAGLSYFKVDTSGVEARYKSAMAWVSDQGDRVYTAAKEHMPGASSLLGMFMGFRRKKVA